jgi:nucleoid-associated protein YgaU
VTSPTEATSESHDAGEVTPQAPATATNAAARANALLEAAVLAQLAADPVLDATRFVVRANDGEIEIEPGEVPTGHADRALELATLVPGVRAARHADAPAADVAQGSAEGSAAPAPPPQLRAIDDAYALAARMGTPPETPLAIEESDGSGDADEALAYAASGDRPRTWVVQPGDSLSIIAARTMGDGLAWPRIYELNRTLIGPDPQALQAGMELRIPQD